MLPALAAASPTPHATPALSHIRRRYLGLHFLLRRHHLLAASTASPAVAGRGRRLLAVAFASGDGGAVQMKEQGLCTIWNFSIDENLRYKILRSDILIQIVRFLDDEDIKVKEAAVGMISNLALSRSNHGALVEAGVIPKLVHLLQNKEDDYKIIRKEARSSLLELSTDDYHHTLVIEEGLVRVPLVGSAAYKAFRPLPHSRPSFPDGSEIQRSSRPSKYGATELLLGLSVDEKKTKPDEAKVNAMIGCSNQQFLARIGPIELDDEGKEQAGSQRNDLYTILPWIDGVAWLVLILGLEDVSAIAKAATEIGDASINEHMRTSFKEAGAVKPLLQLLKHSDVLLEKPLLMHWKN